MMRSIALLLLCVATTVTAAQIRPATQLEPVTLVVAGRSNATPSISAIGSRVVVAWGATLDGKTDVFVAISEDDGRTFSTPRQVNVIAGEARLGGEMPPRVAWSARGGAPPELVVLWTARGATTEIKLARSLDNGRTFTPAVSLQASGAAGDRGWPALTVDRSGTAHAIWLDHRGLVEHKPGEASSDHEGPDGALMAQRSGLFYVAANDAPAAEKRITTGVCYCCKTALAAGKRGELYAAWRHVYPGNIRDIAFSVSRSAGPFAAPVRVSEDQWELNGCPDDGPAMAVDDSGTVHLVWPTVLSDPEPEGALFYSTTRDGVSFTPRVRIPTQGSPKPSHPQIAVDVNGGILIAWDEVLAGTRHAFMRPAHARLGRLEFAPATALDPGVRSMYPVIATGQSGSFVAWTSGASNGSVIRMRRYQPARSVR